MVIQAIKLPKIFSPVIAFMFSFGLDVWIQFLRVGDFSNLGIQFRFLAFNQFFFNMHDAPIGFGISLTSCFFLAVLFRFKPQPVVIGALPSAPPTWG